MPKLWIVHRNPRHRAALARLCGLPPRDVESGPPREDHFAEMPAPAAVLLGLEDDFEHELELAHRMRPRLPRVSWILLCKPEDAAEAARLFDVIEPEILDALPTARLLRARLAAAMARRAAASLAERRQRSRIAERFSAWLGGIEVPGLLRALDPSLASLPLLVRGVPGSGRALLCQYVEICRNGRSPSLRLHGGDVEDAEDLAHRLAAARSAVDSGPETVWIHEIDQLPTSAQGALAEWIRHGLPSGTGLSGGGEAPRWIATAGPSSWQDPLEPDLQRAFAPLEIQVPALAEHPETIPGFVEEVARDWARSIGGAPRRFAPSALAEIEAQTWEGDRAQVEAMLRATLAASRADPIEAEDLALESWDQDDQVAARPAPSPASQDRPDTAEALEDEIEAEVQALSDHELDESSFLSEASFALTRLAEMEEPAEETETPVPPAAGRQASEGWRRLARSLSHEIRNPLVSIRTFAELLPEHYQDETFRQRFVELVGQDVAHIGDVLSRLSSVAELEKLEPQAFDISAMIESLLEERREQIQRNRLLVLRELERDAPLAWADPEALQVALAGLLDRALASLPERGDLFVATRHLARGPRGAACLRVLLRHHDGGGDEGENGGGEATRELDELSPATNVLEYVLAQSVVESSGGSFTIDSTDAQETLILLDLPTPGAAA